MLFSVIAWITPFVIGYIILSRVRRWLTIDNIKNRYILITGCDHGYGNLLAQRLDMLGCHVIAACATEGGKNRLQQMTSSHLKAFKFDFGRENQIKQAVDYVQMNLPEDTGLWAVVNNMETHGDVVGPVDWHTTDDFRALIDVNTLAPIRMTLAFLPLIKKAKGRVVIMAHVYGRIAHPIYLPYSVSKAAIESFADGLRVHLSQYGATVHILEPGHFQTDISEKQRLRKAVQQAWKTSSRSLKEEYGEQYKDNLISHVTSTVNNASPKVNHVIKAYLHALTARCPRSRYTVGVDAYLTWIPLSYMPSVLADLLFSKWTKDLLPDCLKLCPKSAETDTANDEHTN
ncbi:hypothetical protein LSH36_305g02021 [Paralvinella palmiformis]|uniref:Uncharacterized protein n=1 Tax=Paralvinella palmiformis TaxID=53620 RepID=A0AAD9N2L2_9ANNE|nr:hypothetical protein LSH36_305g02021 [Paralvinella palmiformis]